MSRENELERLEGFVATLLGKYNALQGVNTELTERIQRRDTTIETLEEELASMKDERGDVSSRVSSLIEKIEEWESTSGVSAETDEFDSDDDASDPGVQGNLFSEDGQDGE